MELLSVSVEGWRRFKDRTTLQTDGKLISILGPNEAGKSSILAAIYSLNSNDPIDDEDVARGSKPSDVKIVGRFFLTSEEIKAAGLKEPSWYVLTKTASGKRTHQIEPAPPVRDVSNRKSGAKAIQRALENEDFSAEIDEELVTNLQSLQELLDIDIEDLPADTIAALRDAASAMASEKLDSFPKYVRALPEWLLALAEYESETSPKLKALAVLGKRCPAIWFFDDDARLLEEEYALNEAAAHPPKALANLAGVADIDLPELYAAVVAEKAPIIASLLSRANATLARKFAAAWSQSNVRVTFTIDTKQRLLKVLIEEDDHQFTSLMERSDGLRQFVALQAFALPLDTTIAPILLIDEAELHLHYDAQADLVQTLARQNVASKVIYTTHSAGCLPEDLGSGVRLATPLAKNSPWSRIVNRFWSAKQPGFSPLLIGMGASTLAFFPTRKALQVEGETEMLVLPTLLREALKKETLGYQVVPGLAKSTKSQLPLAIDGEGQIAYLTDGDSAGIKINNDLKALGVPEKRVFQLPANMEIEDFINPKILVDALNRLLEKFHGTSDRIVTPDSSLPLTYKEMRKQFRAIGKSDPSKIDVAYELLRTRRDHPNSKLINGTKLAAFKALSSKIDRYFLSGEM